MGYGYGAPQVVRSLSKKLRGFFTGRTPFNLFFFCGSDRVRVTRPHPGCLESSRPDPTRPDPTRPDPTRPDPTRPDPTRPDPTRPDPTRPYSTRPDMWDFEHLLARAVSALEDRVRVTRPDPGYPESSRPDPTRPDPTRLVGF